MADITIVNGVYKPTYNWGAPSCRVLSCFIVFYNERRAINPSDFTASKAQSMGGSSRTQFTVVQVPCLGRFWGWNGRRPRKMAIFNRKSVEKVMIHWGLVVNSMIWAIPKFEVYEIGYSPKKPLHCDGVRKMSPSHGEWGQGNTKHFMVCSKGNHPAMGLCLRERWKNTPRKREETLHRS